MMGEVILAIETVASPASVCLLRGDYLVEQKFIDNQKDVSSLLSKNIEELIKDHLQGPNEISKIAVSIGPGSFTGLRVGLSIAKGMAFVLKKPLVPVNTLKAMFLSYKQKSNEFFNYYLPLIDAKRNRALMAVYGQNGEVIQDTRLIEVDEIFFKKIVDSQSVLLPLHLRLSSFFKEREINFKTINLTSLHIGLVAKDSVLAFDEKVIAYLEPNYVINNYLTKGNGQISTDSVS